MAEQDKKLMRHMWANIVILIVAVFAILLLTQQENYARQMQQINKYIGELSDRTAQHARTCFRTGRTPSPPSPICMAVWPGADRPPGGHGLSAAAGGPLRL